MRGSRTSTARTGAPGSFTSAMGLWVLTQCLAELGLPPLGGDDRTRALLGQAARLPAPAKLFDHGDESLIGEGGMLSRVDGLLRAVGSQMPDSAAAIVRVILESLAVSCVRRVKDAARLTDREIAVIHLIGGGARIELFARLLARHSGISVEAGPHEATGIGNALIQARALGVVAGDVPTLRTIVRRSFPPRRYSPTASD